MISVVSTATNQRPASMNVAFFDIHMNVHHEFVLQGQIVYAQYYCDLLRRLRETPTTQMSLPSHRECYCGSDERCDVSLLISVTACTSYMHIQCIVPSYATGTVAEIYNCTSCMIARLSLNRPPHKESFQDVWYEPLFSPAEEWMYYSKIK